MSRTDWRGVCEELLDEVLARPLFLDRALIDRARAALAQPEPQRVELTDEEIRDLAEYDCNFDRLIATSSDGPEGVAWECKDSDLIAFARAVLASWGRPAPALAWEVAELVGLFRSWADSYPDGVKLDSQWLTRAADLLEMCFSQKIAHDGSGNNE